MFTGSWLEDNCFRWYGRVSISCIKTRVRKIIFMIVVRNCVSSFFFSFLFQCFGFCFVQRSGDQRLWRCRCDVCPDKLCSPQTAIVADKNFILQLGRSVLSVSFSPIVKEKSRYLSVSVTVWRFSVLIKRYPWARPSSAQPALAQTLSAFFESSPPYWHNPQWWTVESPVVWCEDNAAMLELCVWNLKKCFHSSVNGTTLKVMKGKNMKNFLLIHRAKIKMWLMLSLNKDYADASQRDERLNSFSLVASQWVQKRATDRAPKNEESLF